MKMKVITIDEYTKLYPDGLDRFMYVEPGRVRAAITMAASEIFKHVWERYAGEQRVCGQCGEFWRAMESQLIFDSDGCATLNCSFCGATHTEVIKVDGLFAAAFAIMRMIE